MGKAGAMGGLGLREGEMKFVSCFLSYIRGLFRGVMGFGAWTLDFGLCWHWMGTRSWELGRNGTTRSQDEERGQELTQHAGLQTTARCLHQITAKPILRSR